MYSGMGDTTSLVPGFPIRTSSDQCSVDSSPRLIAASYVLHRLPVPRHPPCALKHLQHKKPIRKKKLHINTQTHPQDPKASRADICVLDARNHYPQIKHHTPPPKQGNNTPPTPHRGQGKTGLLSQSPIVCLMIRCRHPRRTTQVCRAPEPDPLQIQAHPTNRLTHRTPTGVGGSKSRGAP